MLALCAVWSSPHSARRGDQRRARPPGSRPDTGTDSRHQLSTTGPSRPSCCGPWAQACLWALPAPGSSGNQLFPREPGRTLLGGLQLCGRGVLGFCPFPFSSCSPCLASSPRPRLAPPVVVAVRFLRSLLSVCKHSCVMSVGQAPGAEKWNRLSRRSVEPLLCWRAPARRSSVTPHGVALPRGAPGDGSVAPSPREAGPAGQTGLVASSWRSERQWPFGESGWKVECVQVKLGLRGAQHWHTGWSSITPRLPCAPFSSKVAPSPSLAQSTFTCPPGTWNLTSSGHPVAVTWALPGEAWRHSPYAGAGTAHLNPGRWLLSSFRLFPLAL